MVFAIEIFNLESDEKFRLEEFRTQNSEESGEW
jgi:hypothetical protein